MAQAKLNVVSANEIKVDTDIPPPELTKRQKYPFREMEVGHSFAVTKSDYVHVTSAASYFGTRNDRKYSVRRHGDAYRCWRIA